ncbi:Uncharacterized protein TCM_007854 [Theobroma cacao]|uniref:Uncharacterized protein n=1 Tax=Theobroma cacao TaxID=3641 RepID=A0A061E3R7_THECC|nr:Uncharacterized protein TCM_007854 [Theobroma cacao]
MQEVMKQVLEQLDGVLDMRLQHLFRCMGFQVPCPSYLRVNLTGDANDEENPKDNDDDSMGAIPMDDSDYVEDVGDGVNGEYDV